MTDRTAHDAVIGMLVRGDEHPWVQPPPDMVADAILAELGIDPDTPTDDVKAGVIFLRMSRDSFHNEIVLTVNPDDPQQQDERPWWVAESHAGIAYGLSPAAAVLALAARLEEQ